MAHALLATTHTLRKKKKNLPESPRIKNRLINIHFFIRDPLTNLNQISLTLM